MVPSELASLIPNIYARKPSNNPTFSTDGKKYDIAEVVDPYVNVVAKVPKKVLAQIPKAAR